jgi:hypothetical protein
MVNQGRVFPKGVFGMTVTIEIKDGLVGYQFKDDNDNVVQFENLPRREQVRILNGFANGYKLFRSVLKGEEE